MTPNQFPFGHSLRPRYAEIDAQGVVFNAHYFSYFDVALTEAMRELNLNWLEQTQAGQDFHLVHASADYHQPVKFDEMIDIRCRVEKLGNSSVHWTLAVFGQDSAGQSKLRTTGKIIWVYTDLNAGQSVALPEPIRRFLQERLLHITDIPTASQP